MKTMNKFALLLPLLASPFALTAAEQQPTTAQPNDATQTQAEETPDMSNPMSVYSALGLQVGSNGLQVSSQLGYTPKDGRSHMGFIEYRNDDNLNNLRVRYFTPNAVGFGITADVSYSELAINNKTYAVNSAVTGFMQMLPINEKLMLFPTIMAGSMWSNDDIQGEDLFATTTIATVGTYIRYTIGEGDKFWLYGNPMYTYGFDGEEVREMFFEGGVGYKLSGTETLRFNGNNEGDLYLSYSMAL